VGQFFRYYLIIDSTHFHFQIVAGTIQSKQDAMDYLTWTFFFRRLLKNPTYYGLESLEAHDINLFLSNLVEQTVAELMNAGCVVMTEVRSLFNQKSVQFNNLTFCFIGWKGNHGDFSCANFLFLLHLPQDNLHVQPETPRKLHSL